MGSDEQPMFHFLHEMAPCFPINGDKVAVVETPSEFYQHLLEGIKSSKERIVLSALYLGTGGEEQKLLNCLFDVLKEREEQNICMDVDLLFDCVRGSRGKINSKTMLLPLVQQYGNPASKTNLSVLLYHTPFLRGTVKQALPARFNEIVGLNHMKVFIFDDNFLISGANLSSEYFQQRQDRYIYFKNCHQLSDFFHSLVKAVGKFSYQLQSNGDVVLSDTFSCHPVTGDLNQFQTFAYDCLNNVLKMYKKETSYYQNLFSDFMSKNVDKSSDRKLHKIEVEGSSVSSRCLTDSESTKYLDTLVFPTIQFGFIGMKQDEQVTTKLFESFPLGSYVCFTSGYFNITDIYSNKILQSLADFDIIIASPDANGFLKAAGVAGNIPAVYSHLTKQFYHQICKEERVANINIWEYIRPNWTYHAKGIWFYEKQMPFPSMTTIGSSNYGLRSVNRDLEAQVTLLTKNKNLMGQLHQEKCNLMKYSRLISNDTFSERRYHVPRWVSIVTTFIKRYF